MKMKTSTWASLVLAVMVASGLIGCGQSREKKWERMTDQFVECVPASVTEQQRREIAGLLETFWARAQRGEVYEEDVNKIESKLRSYIDAGTIEPDSLAYFMALVGYNSYRKDPRYNLPERIVDHPTLNPDAAIMVFGSDSTGPRAQLMYRVPRADSTAGAPRSDTTKAPSKKERLDGKKQTDPIR
jgi:hypothetical protein